MRYTFFGTPDFARTVLEELLRAGLPPVALVSNPDRPRGRGLTLAEPPTKRLLKDSGFAIPILQPEEITPAFLEELRALDTEIFVVAAYSKILPPELIAIPPRGILGVHPSLLPALRGASPIQQTILDGVSVTGTTIFLIDEKMDHGPILAREEVALTGRETMPDLSRTLAVRSGALLAATLSRFATDEILPVPQDHARATFTKKFSTADAFVPLDDVLRAVRGEDGAVAVRIERMIRALNPEPGVWTTRADGARVKLLEASLSPEGALVLETTQLEGKPPASGSGPLGF